MHDGKRIADLQAMAGSSFQEAAQQALGIAGAREWQYERLTIHPIESYAGTAARRGAM
jgi:hypothetical protein